MRKRSNLLLEQLEQLIETAEKEKDANVLIILYSLRGTLHNGDDGLLAAKVQEYVKEFLMPKAEREIETGKASLN